MAPAIIGSRGYMILFLTLCFPPSGLPTNSKPQAAKRRRVPVQANAVR